MPRQLLTVKPEGGGNFPTLPLGVAFAKLNHTVADPITLKCFKGILLTAQMFINAFTIPPAAGSEFIINGDGNPHDGTYSDLTQFAHLDLNMPGSGSAIRIIEPYVHLLRLSANYELALGSFNRIYRWDASTHHGILDGCLGVTANNTGAPAEMFMGSMNGIPGAEGRIINNLMVLTGSDGASQQGYRVSAGMAEFSNNTFMQTGGPVLTLQGYQYTTNTCDNFFNNICIGAAQCYSLLGTVTARGNNISDDGSGDPGFTGQTLAGIIADPANSFFPKAGSLATAGNGAERSGSYTLDAINKLWVPFGIGGLFGDGGGFSQAGPASFPAAFPPHFKASQPFRPNFGKKR